MTEKAILPGGLRPTKARRKTVERRFDQTCLDIENNQGFLIHRDYGAHFFKYGFARRLVSTAPRAAGSYPIINFADIGCGPKFPIAWTFIQPRPPFDTEHSRIVGLDLSRVKHAPGARWVRVHDEIDVTTDETRDFLLAEYGGFDFLSCLEVIEHMPPADGDNMLRAMRAIMKPEAVAMISTPVFNGSQAANHIYEYEIDELKEKFPANGFKIVDRYGTFMSVHDVKKALDTIGDDAVAAKLLDIYTRIRSYYSDEVVAMWFAPMFPDFSRNNVWVIKRDDSKLPWTSPRPGRKEDGEA